MSRHDDLISSLFRLVHIVRSGHLKRALTEVDPEPHLNFWRLLHGSQLDIAVLEWCKIFGADAEPTHWKKVISEENHQEFRTAMLAHLGIDAGAWAAYRNELKDYRDSQIAHHFEVPKVDKYPQLHLAIQSACFFYKWLIAELRALGETKYPEDLAEYASRFETQAIEIGRHAIGATKDMQERVF